MNEVVHNNFSFLAYFSFFWVILFFLVALGSGFDNGIFFLLDFREEKNTYTRVTKWSVS